MKAIMYHYVREYDDLLPNFRFLDFRNFGKQLDFFERNFGFVEKEEWDEALTSGLNETVSGKVILTFDDAMSCHYDYVFPELEKRNLWGIFYVPSLPYVENKILDVHRIHLLCGAYDGRDILNILLNIVTEDMIPDTKIKEFRNKTYSNQKNYEGVSEFKRILNYFVSYDYRESIINDVAESLDYKFDPDNFYTSVENLIKMNSAGNIIGSHSVNHPVMSKLSRAKQHDQIKDSFDFLNRIGCIQHKTYCHPYGGFHSFNNDTIDLLESEGVDYSFNVESREITINDLKNSKHFLPRFDCNLFEFGDAS